MTIYSRSKDCAAILTRWLLQWLFSDWGFDWPGWFTHSSIGVKNLICIDVFILCLSSRFLRNLINFSVLFLNSLLFFGLFLFFYSLAWLEQKLRCLNYFSLLMNRLSKLLRVLIKRTHIILRLTHLLWFNTLVIKSRKVILHFWLTLQIRIIYIVTYLTLKCFINFAYYLILISHLLIYGVLSSVIWIRRHIQWVSQLWSTSALLLALEGVINRISLNYLLRSFNSIGIIEILNKFHLNLIRIVLHLGFLNRKNY